MTVRGSNFIIMASIAAGFWVVCLVSLWRLRARVTIVPGLKR